MSVTMKDIAVAAGVSTATVSKVINGLDQKISTQTRLRINELIQDMGYTPNAVAKGLKIKSTKMIGFILPDISNPFFPEIARGLEDAAKSRGFGVVLCNTDDGKTQEMERFRFLSSRMVDGIVFIRSLRRGELERFASGGIPIVLVDREVDAEGLGFGQIYIDTQKGTYESTKALIQAGCKKIAFISADQTSGYDRYYGYCKSLQDFGLPVDTNRVYRRLYNVETGYDGVNYLLEKNDFDGIVCGNDLIAVGAMKALTEKGLRVPEDIKVIGFDDIYFSRYLNPPLSTVHQPAYEMGAEAATMLIDNIVFGTPLKKKKLNYTLVLRGTS